MIDVQTGVVQANLGSERVLSTIATTATTATIATVVDAARRGV